MARRRRKEKKKSIFSKRNMVGMFIVGIMVLSGIGYMWSGDGNTNLSYNDHKFILQNNRWYTQIDDKYAEFDFHPSDLEYMELSPEVIDYLRNVKMLYIVFDPDSRFIQDFEVARVRLEQDLPKFLKIFPVTGVTANSTQYSHFPIVTCENSTMFVPVLYFRQGNTTAFILQDTCIILQAQDRFDVPALTDRLMYSLLEIM